MSKRSALKAKLRAADRRRKSRNSPTNDGKFDQTTAAAPHRDVVGMMTEVILSVAEKRKFKRDSDATAALRGLQQGTPPKSESALELFERLGVIVATNGLTIRQVRRATESLLNLASQHKSNDEPRNFLRYLSVLAS